MTVENSAEIQAQLKEVYELAKNIYGHTGLMPDVRSVRMIERSEDGSRVVCESVGVVKEFKTLIKWTAEDIWDDEAKTCKFSLIKSGHYTYSGQWTFTDLGDTTKFSSNIEVECDLPKVGKHIMYLAARKMRENVDNMLAAIKAKVKCGVA